MVETEEGTLRVLQGPLPFVPNYSTGGAPASHATASVPTSPGPLTYGPMYGVFHAQVGYRDILLVHTGEQLLEFEGWNRGLFVPRDGSGPPLISDLENDFTPSFPTQFENVGSGIVIAFQNTRPHFYDGHVIAPLGYDRAPGAPTGSGPTTTTTGVASGSPATPTIGAVNEGGYAHDKNQNSVWDGTVSQTEMLLGSGRLGTTQGNADDTEALAPGEYRAAAQWIDLWGNLSPMSGVSNGVAFKRQVQTAGSKTGARADGLLKQVLWDGIEPGPTGTVGRVLLRTKDMLHAGTQKLFEVPPNASDSPRAFATLPDNVSTLYPDNIPDAWLLKEAEDVVAVPRFKLCRMAFGRLWIANFAGAKSLVRWSIPGRWGTFLRNDVMAPDTAGTEITGLWRVAGGLLIFTEASTFMVVPSDDGQAFRSFTLHAQIGCTAPSSIATLPNGLTVWLGREGFYAFDGKEITPTPISDDLQRELRSINKARRRQACAAVDVRHREYRCWLPTSASADNDLCFVLTEQGWRRRTDVAARAVCVTQDHRGYMLAAGKHGATNGLWLLDHAVQSYDTTAEGVIETAWIEAASSEHRKSPKRVTLWLREDQSGALTVEMMRDWRETVVDTYTGVLLYPSDDAPPFWDAAVLGASGTAWKRRRPYWRKLDIHVPSCEVFKLRLSLTSGPSGTSKSWDFLGLVVDVNPKLQSGIRTPP